MDVDAYIDRWKDARGGAERANYQMFLTQLCEAVGLPLPDPASADTASNDYVFERGVKRRESEGTASTTRIDLYKRGCFILEAKQSRADQRQAAASLAFRPEETASTAAAEGRWDDMMRSARRQAEDYVVRLPTDHAAPPFIIVCDVGYVFEVFADFSGSGRGYSAFPDRKGFRIRLEDLRREDIRDRLRAVWTDPQSLDPTRESARVTRQIAERLAAVSRRLEKNHPPEEVAHFLMRCIFTMFAEDVDLLPRGEFTRLLEDSLDGPDSFAPLLQELWRKMDARDHADRFFSLFRTHLRWFNGNLFRDARAFAMTREEIGELLAASRHDWRYVEPAIFGTLVEQALDPAERRKLGAHYTPRSYVERLVEVTVMEPLRADWSDVEVKVGDARERGDMADAVARVRAFHHQLCATRVLDPACGTGNFLYVALELMKTLEGTVLEALAQLGETETIGLETVDPHQFLGIELNVRAAAIAELVLWIGYLQQHYRNRSEHPAEPILKAFGNIQQKDAVLTWDGYPEMQFEMRDGAAVQVFPNARRPDWPEAEFIVGNPPFLGKGAAMRGPLGDSYVEALWTAHSWIDQSTDLVMYWWDRAAELLVGKKAILRRFGLVTTNSLSGVFNRRTLERHLKAKTPVSVIYAVPDQPWTKASADSAAVRISMTVVMVGSHDGRLDEVTHESGLETDDPLIVYNQHTGRIHADLEVGADVAGAKALLANEGIACNGVMLAGQGFVLSAPEAELLSEGDANAGAVIRPFLNGAELVRSRRGRSVIDAFGLDDASLRQEHPAIYQHLLQTVKPERDLNRREAFRRRWWVFGEPRRTFRPALEYLPRFIGTTETSKHRLFQFIEAKFLVDHMIIAIALDGGTSLALLSSRVHVNWATRAGGWLGVGNDPRYSKSRCFDPFPFPDPDEATRARLRALGEELDATRKTVQAEHPDLTLTGLYNVLEKVRAGAELTPAEADVKARGRVLILKDLHDQIDRATMQAYGWDDLIPLLSLSSSSGPRSGTGGPSGAREREPVVASGVPEIVREQVAFGAAGSPGRFAPEDDEGKRGLDEIMLERLVALNAERAAEEAAGHVRWLRPDYQIPRFAKGAAAPRTGELDLAATVVAIDMGLPAFPKDKGEQVMAIRAVLQASSAPMDAAAVSRAFKGGGRKIEQRVVQALNTLVRYAEITALADGRFAARRAA